MGKNHKQNNANADGIRPEEKQDRKTAHNTYNDCIFVINNNVKDADNCYKCKSKESKKLFKIGIYIFDMFLKLSEKYILSILDRI